MPVRTISKAQRLARKRLSETSTMMLRRLGARLARSSGSAALNERTHSTLLLTTGRRASVARQSARWQQVAFFSSKPTKNLPRADPDDVAGDDLVSRSSRSQSYRTHFFVTMQNKGLDLLAQGEWQAAVGQFDSAPWWLAAFFSFFF
jgi:hypothetical protein